MAKNNFAYFEVTIKLLLNKGDKILALTTQDGFLDFPGGRVDEVEANIPFKEVLKREVKEELGTNVNIKVNNLAFVSKRQYTKNGQDFRTLAIFYEAEFVAGKIDLSNEHKISDWIKPADLLAKNNKYMSKDEEDQLKAYYLG